MADDFPFRKDFVEVPAEHHVRLGFCRLASEESSKWMADWKEKNPEKAKQLSPLRIAIHKDDPLWEVIHNG